MIELIQSYSDQIVTAMFLVIAVALLVARPKVACCRRHRWEAKPEPTRRPGPDHRSR